MRDGRPYPWKQLTDNFSTHSESETPNYPFHLAWIIMSTQLYSIVTGALEDRYILTPMPLVMNLPSPVASQSEKGIGSGHGINTISYKARQYHCNSMIQSINKRLWRTNYEVSKNYYSEAVLGIGYSYSSGTDQMMRTFRGPGQIFQYVRFQSTGHIVIVSHRAINLFTLYCP